MLAASAAFVAVLVAGVALGTAASPRATAHFDASEETRGAHARRLSSSRLKPSGTDLAEWQRQTDEVREEKRLNDELREANRRAFAGRDPAAGPRRLGVCVCGQMARLELQRKIDHLLRPNRDDFVLDVVLALAPSDTVSFAYATNNVGGMMNWTAASIRAAIGDAVGNGTVVIDDTKPYANPLLQRSYVESAYRKGPSWVRNAVRMWSNYWRCYQHFTRLEQANGAPYDVLIKVRDDGWVVSDIRIGSEDLTPLWTGRVIVPECRPEGGYNDRWGIMDAAHGYAYFGAQYVDYYLNWAELWGAAWAVSTNPRRRPGNAENHLKGALHLYKAPALPVSANAVPIVQSRTASTPNGGARACVSMRGFDLGPEEQLACVPTDAAARALVYCDRCDDGAAGHSTTCEHMCACVSAGNATGKCAELIDSNGGFCLRAAVLGNAPIEQADCGMCVRHRCSLWGGNKCASKWGFSDPQGAQRLECECACCRQACGHERMCDVGDFLPDKHLEEPRERTLDGAPRARGARAQAFVALALAAGVALVSLATVRQRDRAASSAGRGVTTMVSPR